MPDKSGLRRELGVWAATSIVIGTVIGSGIFLVPSEMIQAVGTPGEVFLVWIVGGTLSMFGALAYAELAAALPEAGGEYAFLREAYGPFAAFVYGWTQTLVAKSASIATIATGFYLYSAHFLPALSLVCFTVPLPIGPGWAPLEVRYGQLLAMAVILFLGWLNYQGVRAGGGVQVVLTAVKVGMILAIILLGLLLPGGTVANFGTSTAATGGIAGFFAALLAALWAYDGWNNVSMVAAEVKNPQRNFPLALIGGLLTVAAIYMLANAAYFYVLPSDAVAKSGRVAADAMFRVLGAPGASVVSLAAMISTFAALNGSILSGSRIPYALASDGLFFRRIAEVDPRHHTPGAAILLLSVLSAILVLSGHFRALYTLVLFPSWILYAMATASVIVLRRKRPELPRPYRTLGYPVTPILFVGAALALLISTLYSSPRESLLGTFIILAGIPFYFYWKRRRNSV